MEYTKGEWKVTDTNERGCGGVFVVDKDHRTLAHCKDGGFEEKVANAHLISASPRMYEYIKGRAEDGDNDAKCFLAVLGLE